MANQVRYFKWRDGRPRWEPGPKLRRLGFKGRDLRGVDGAWLTRAAALAEAERLNEEMDQGVAAGTRPGRQPRGPRRHAQSCEALWEAYTSSPRFQRLSPATQRDYRSKGRIWLETFGPHPVRAVDQPHLYKWWERLYADRGHAMANGTIAVVRVAMSHARRIGWRSDNPALHLGLETVAPRCVVWSPSEIEHVIASADRLGFAGVADAVVVALHTAQRQGDVLALELAQIDGGRCLFRQSKTGARVAVPHTGPLAERLAVIRARQGEAGVVDLALARRIILNRGQPYTVDRFRKHWRRVRAIAAETMPSIADKQFLDLRDTAITRLALAGCTVPEIRAISGHSLETVHQVLKHYLALDDRFAVSAIARLKAWMHDEGIAV